MIVRRIKAPVPASGGLCRQHHLRTYRSLIAAPLIALGFLFWTGLVIANSGEGSQESGEDSVPRIPDKKKQDGSGRGKSGNIPTSDTVYAVKYPLPDHSAIPYLPALPMFGGQFGGTGMGSGSGAGASTANRTQETNEQATDPCESTGSPVVITSGNKVLDARDFATATGDFILSRHYSKQSTIWYGFGPGWTATYFDRLYFVADPNFSPECEPGTYEPGVPCLLQNQRHQEIVTRRANGHNYAYLYNPATGRYEDSRPDSRSWIVANYWSDPAMDSFTLTHEDGSVETYNGPGLIRTKHSPRGIGYTYSYYNNLPLNNGTMVRTITHTSGRKIEFTWSDNRIASVTDPDNNVYTYGYTNGLLTSVNYPDNLGTVTYHYEDANHPGALTGYSIDGERRTRYAYQADGRVAWSGREGGIERDSFSYDSDHTDVTNALGLTVRHGFVTRQGIKRLASVDRPSATACAGGLSTIDYDTRGYRTSETDFKGNQTFYTYSDAGELLELRTGVGPAPGNSTASQQRSTYEWDTDRRLMLRESRYGSTGSIQSETRYVYHPDSDGARARLLQRVEECASDCDTGQKRTTTYAYTLRSNGMVQSVVVDGPIAGNEDAVTYQYDPVGNLTSVSNGKGHTTTWSNYNGLGLPGRVVDPNGAMVEYSHDARGRVVESRSIVAGVAQTTTYSYDSAGQLVSTTSPDGVTLTREYDPVGRLLREYRDEADGTFEVKRYSYNNASQVTSVKVQRTTAVTKPTGTPTLSIAPGAAGSFTVSWTTASGVEYYQLQQKVDGGGWATTNEGLATSKAFSGQPGGTYAYRARACNAEGCTGYSAEAGIEVVYPPASAPAVTAPSSNNTGGFTVSWTSIGTANRYELQQRKDGGSWSKIHDAAGTSKAVSGLGNGSYGYRARACNVGGCSSYSSVKTTVVTHPPGSAPTLTAPATNNTGGFTVSWTSVGTATRYELQQRKDSGSWSKIQDAAGTSKTVSGLDDGSYNYRVRACNAGGCGSYSAAKTTVVTHPPGTAPVVTAPSASSSGSYSVTWTSVGAATEYRLQRRKDGGSWSQVYSGTARSRSESDLSNGSYQYRVRACNVGGCSSYSAARTTVVTHPPGSAPTLTAPSASSNGSYSVTWTSVGTATEYRLQRRKDSGSWSQIYSGTGRSRSESGLSNGSYQYRVRACNVGGCSGYSAARTTVVTHPPGSTPTVTTPATSSSGAFSVTWTSVGTATRYELQQRRNGGSWSKIHDAAARSKAVSGLANGTYDYRVRACNVGGCSSYSAVKSTVVTHPPGTPTATAPSASNSGSYSVTWTSISTTTRYELQRRKNSGSWSQIYSGTARSRSESGLSNGSYQYRVRACNVGGCSSYSAVRTTVVTHPPSGAPTLAQPGRVGSKNTFSWSAVSTATRYELQNSRNGGASWDIFYNGPNTNFSGHVIGTNSFRVRACNVGGCGPYSNIRTITVNHPPNPCLPGEICFDPESVDPTGEDQ